LPDALEAANDHRVSRGSAQEQQLLIERYLNDPKPVLWARRCFNRGPRNHRAQTVARCYPALIALAAELRSAGALHLASGSAARRFAGCRRVLKTIQCQIEGTR